MAPATWCLQFQNVLGTSSFTSSDVSPPLHHLLRLAKGGLDVFPVCRLHCSVQSANQVKGEAKRLFVWSLCGMGERGDASWSLPSGSPFSGQLWGASCAINFDAAAWCQYDWHYQGGQAERSLSTLVAFCPPPPPTDCLPVPASDLYGKGRGGCSRICILSFLTDWFAWERGWVKVFFHLRERK